MFVDIVRYLKLSNSLSGVIPSSFLSFSNLTWLDLSSNKLTGGLENLSNHTASKLEYLDLSDNYFGNDSVKNGDVRNWISSFPSLRVYDLRNNLFNLSD